MGSTKLIGQLHWSLFIVYYCLFLLYLFLAQLDSAFMRAQMQMSVQFKYLLYKQIISFNKEDLVYSAEILYQQQHVN